MTHLNPFQKLIKNLFENFEMEIFFKKNFNPIANEMCALNMYYFHTDVFKQNHGRKTNICGD